MLRDILYHLGYDTSKKNKEILHAFHKRVLGYESIAGCHDSILKTFLFEVGVFWAERGIFVRTNSRQEIGIENEDLDKIWDKL